MSADPRSTVASIPGWQDARVEVLSGGLTNRTYLVRTEDRKAVLKIDAERRSDPYTPRIEEARIQKRAADAGLANAVLYVEETVLLTDYIEGVTWTPPHFDSDANLVQLAGALRQLHALPLSGRSFDAVAAAHRYLDAIGDADPVIAQKHVATIDSVRRPGNLCLCHNDLVAGNIVSTPEVMFLDWEYACDNDPFFDLATVVAHHELSNRQAELLLDAYFDGEGQRWRRQLADQERLYNALNWLWAAALRSPAIS